MFFWWPLVESPGLLWDWAFPWRNSHSLPVTPAEAKLDPGLTHCRQTLPLWFRELPQGRSQHPARLSHWGDSINFHKYGQNHVAGLRDIHVIICCLEWNWVIIVMALAMASLLLLFFTTVEQAPVKYYRLFRGGDEPAVGWRKTPRRQGSPPQGRPDGDGPGPLPAALPLPLPPAPAGPRCRGACLPVLSSSSPAQVV